MNNDYNSNFYTSENDGYRGGLGGYTDPEPNQSPRPAQHKKGNGAAKVVALVLACTVLGTGAGVGGAAWYLHQSSAPSTTLYESSRPPVEVLSIASGKAMTPDQLYAANVDSTVGISVSTTMTNVFGQVSTAAASGSGFVISQDGYIVTNHHVIADATGGGATITVSFADGTSYDATLVGYEADNDVAVLKIDAQNLQAVTLGDSDNLVIGETVMAIGNPLGELTFSITDGLISAMDRLITTEDGSTMNMLQTNTAINPGNSGGALFNSYGEVIGITTAKYSSASNGTTVEGLGFAIPINDVKSIVSDLIQYGYVTGRPYLGIQVTDVPAVAQQYGVSAGAAISYVAEGSCAAKGGLVAGDIIIALDDTAVDSSSALTAALTAYRAGDSVNVTVIREGGSQVCPITLDEKNDTTEANNQLPQVEQPQVSQWPQQEITQWPFGNIFP